LEVETVSELDRLFQSHQQLANEVHNVRRELSAQNDHNADRVLRRIELMEREQLQPLSARVTAVERVLARMKGAIALLAALPALLATAWQIFRSDKG
jgi:hypothetical protein